MPAHPPLLSRLRRRVRGFGVLFALLLLGKLVFAGLCFGDGFASAQGGAGVAALAALDGHGLAQAPGTDDEGGCWHAGAGGCHCNCVHAMPMRAEQAAVSAVPFPSAHLSPDHFEAAGLPAPFVPLRPPIA